ncbi:MAG: hypothetical protein HZB65_01940 [Candidatus Aenigmarchaeota archaeon]|nr:hypothetical protein [Candidatus Aenigmarchaeota archaeon]
MKQILLADPEERLRILRKIFDIDKYGIIRNNASGIVMRELRSMKKIYEAQTADIEQKRHDRSRRADDILRNKKDLLEKRASLDKIDNEIKQNEHEVERIGREIKQMSLDMQECARLGAFAEQKKKRIDSIRKEIIDNEKRINELDKLLLNRPIAKEIDDKDAVSKKSLIEKEKQMAVMQRGVIENEIRKLSVILGKGLCEFCGQNVADRAGFSARLDDKRRLAETLVKKIANADNELKIIEETRKKSIEYQYELRIFEERKRNYDDVLRKNKILYDERNALDNEVVSIVEELSRKSIDKQLFSKLEDLEKNAKSELIIKRRNRDGLSSMTARLESTIESLDKEVERIDKEIMEKEMLKETIDNIGSVMSWIDLTFIPLMESMEQHVMNSIQGEFNRFFQQWFSVLMAVENMSVKSDRQFSPVIEQAGYETSFQNLSGGEKTAVALAYRLALNKVINSLVETIKTKDLIILDEPTDGFSTEQLDRVRDVLNELNLNQMIIVSHEPKIDTYVDNVIRFYKEEHVSRIVK